MLLGDALLRRGLRGTYATTIVSSSMLGAIAARARRRATPRRSPGSSGSRARRRTWCYGYEEALGYAVAPDLVRDKDGISAALLVAELAAALKAAGRRCRDRLDELAAEYGRYATDQVSVRVDDLAVIERDDAPAAGRAAGDAARRAGDGRGPAARTPTCCGWRFGPAAGWWSARRAPNPSSRPTWRWSSRTAMPPRPRAALDRLRRRGPRAALTGRNRAAGQPRRPRTFQSP